LNWIYHQYYYWLPVKREDERNNSNDPPVEESEETFRFTDGTVRLKLNETKQLSNYIAGETAGVVWSMHTGINIVSLNNGVIKGIAPGDFWIIASKNTESYVIKGRVDAPSLEAPVLSLNGDKIVWNDVVASEYNIFIKRCNNDNKWVDLDAISSHDVEYQLNAKENYKSEHKIIVQAKRGSSTKSGELIFQLKCGNLEVVSCDCED